jgi:hypothetical protein
MSSLLARRFLVFIAVAISLLADRAFAYRLEFAARRNGKPLQGAEVCFFKAGETDEPLELYLHDDEVRCLSADGVVEITPGRWLYYLRHPDGWMSSAPSVIKYPKAVAEDIFGRRAVDLHPAGTLDFTALSPLGPDESFGLYASNSGTAYLPMLIPIPRREQTAVVPAGMPLLVLRLRHHQVVGVSDPLMIEHGQRAVLSSASFLPSSRERATVLTWINFPPEARNPDTAWDRLPAPAIKLIRNGATLTPSLLPRPGFGTDGALFVFRDVPAGRWTAEVDGKFWAHGGLPIDVSGNLVVTRTGVATRPAGAIDIDWSVAAFRPRDSPCGDDPPPATFVAKAVARLLSCRQWQPSLPLDILDLQQCNVVSERALGEADRHLEFSAVAPADYVVTLKQPAFGISRALASVRVGEVAHANLQFEPFVVSGRVMLDGHPLRARVEFRSGSAISDDDGQYVAALSNAPRDLPVLVKSCGDKKVLYTSLPAASLTPGGRYDIDITSNAVDVKIVDATTHSPVPNATVQVGAFAAGDDDAGAFLAGVEPAADGNTMVSNVPVNRQLVVCAVAAQYRRRCSDRFSMADTKSRSVTVSLERKDNLRGRIIATSPFDWGRIYFVGPDRVVHEEAALAADGTFSYSRTHQAPEYIVVVSNAPLYVGPLPSNPPETLEVSLPSCATRELHVSIDPRSPQKDALVGLFVGGLYVPRAALSKHQGAHGFQSVVYGRGPLIVSSVLETGLVQVTLGPAPQDIGKTIPAVPDPFLLPQYATAPRREAPADGRIVF